MRNNNKRKAQEADLKKLRETAAEYESTIEKLKQDIALKTEIH